MVLIKTCVRGKFLSSAILTLDSAARMGRPGRAAGPCFQSSSNASNMHDQVTGMIIVRVNLRGGVRVEGWKRKLTNAYDQTTDSAYRSVVFASYDGSTTLGQDSSTSPLDLTPRVVPVFLIRRADACYASRER
jgi:hypothetical protein